MVAQKGICEGSAHCLSAGVFSGAPNESIVKNHLNIALLNVF